jgi:Protein of unknown function (DUF2867)
MPQVSTKEFKRRPLRVLTFLAGVPLHDVWSVDLPRWRGWDREPAATASKTFATRLTDTDHSRSLVAPGTSDGFFRVVYRFENEQLVELINRTAHAAALTTLVETTTGYRFYLAVYIRSVSRFTPFYMALIDPFRKLIVYPSLLRSVRARWKSSIRHRLTSGRFRAER